MAPVKLTEATGPTGWFTCATPCLLGHRSRFPGISGHDAGICVL